MCVCSTAVAAVYLLMYQYIVVYCFSFHPTSSKKKRTASSTEGEMMRRYAIKYQQQVQDLLNSLPSDMILLFKTNDCLRHIDSLLGAPVNTITGTSSRILVTYGALTCCFLVCCLRFCSCCHHHCRHYTGGISYYCSEQRGPVNMGPSFVVEGGLDSGRCSGTVDICEDACCRPRLGTPAGRPGTRSPCMGDIFIPPALSRVEPSRANQLQHPGDTMRYTGLYTQPTPSFHSILAIAYM